MDAATAHEQLASLIVSRVGARPLKVGVNGIDGAGKTVLADELGALLRRKGQLVLRSSIERFFNPPEVRYSRGKDDPLGYLDSFDLGALKTNLLAPLSEGGDRQVRLGVYDRARELVSLEPVQLAPPRAILLFDGVFLFVPELRDLWDLHIFVEVSFETALQRTLVRDAPFFGGVDETRRRYLTRYFPGQRLYLEAVSPRALADVVVMNDDYARPELLFQTPQTESP